MVGPIKSPLQNQRRIGRLIWNWHCPAAGNGGSPTCLAILPASHTCMPGRNKDRGQRFNAGWSESCVTVIQWGRAATPAMWSSPSVWHPSSRLGRAWLCFPDRQPGPGRGSPLLLVRLCLAVRPPHTPWTKQHTSSDWTNRPHCQLCSVPRKNCDRPSLFLL